HPSSTVRVESVPRPPDRFDGAAMERLVDLASEVTDVDLHDVRVAVEREIPDVVKDLRLAHDLACASHQTLQYRELASGQPDLRIPAEAPVRDRIDGQVTRSAFHGGCRAGPPEQRAESSPQHDERERL